MGAKKNISVQDTVSATMVEVFKKASSSSIQGISTVETKDGSLVSSKEYTFVNPIGKRGTMKTFDSDIIESTEKIAMALYGKNVLTFAICRELSKINNRDKLDAMGFKNIGEYANALFDLSRVTATQYARIGEVFINDEYQIKSDVLPSGLQKGHLVELLTMVGEGGDISDIENLYLEGLLTDGMSTAKIRHIVKDWKNGTLAIDVEADEVPEIEEKDDTKSSTESGDNKKSKKSDEGKEEARTEDTNVFDVQVEVGKILSACNNITESFDLLNNHEFSVGGYEKALDQIRALATAMLG